MFLNPPISKMAFRKENVLRALDSQDRVVIKDARKAQRQALTRGYNALQKELDKKDDSGQLDFSRISEKWVNEILTKAKEAYRDLVDLHEHYLARSSFGIVNTDKEDDDYLTKAAICWPQVIVVNMSWRRGQRHVVHISIHVDSGAVYCNFNQSYFCLTKKII